MYVCCVDLLICANNIIGLEGNIEQRLDFMWQFFRSWFRTQTRDPVGIVIIGLHITLPF